MATHISKRQVKAEVYPDFTIAHIEINDSVWVYMTYNGSGEVFDKKRCRDREEAIAFVKDAYPNSDIRTWFLG